MVLFKDFKEEVQVQLNQLGVQWLEEAAAEIESQTKKNTKVDTGKTKGSWEHIVHEETLEAEIGSRYKNAVWEEFGTGIYALNGDGRKNVPWTYQDASGKWHKTKGKKPRRALHNAYTSKKNVIIRAARNKFGELK